MRSSTFAFSRLHGVLLGLLLAVAPPFVGYASLPPTREGTAVPVPERTAEMAINPTAEMVVIGNSKAGTDIVVPTLREALRQPELHVQVIPIGSATLPIHYAVIKNLVLQRAHPRTIVVYATGIELLNSDLTVDRRERLLRPYLTAEEPVFARKLYNHPPDGLAGLRERAVTARDGTLSLLAERVAGVVSGGPGREHLDAAFTEVFGQSWATRTRADLSAIPMGGYPSESAIGQVIEDTFVIELETLCHEHGVKLVFAVAPVTGVIGERERTRLRGMEPVLAQAAHHADAWIVLPYPGDDRNNWRDDEHMSAAAAEANTRALGEEMVRLGVGP